MKRGEETLRVLLEPIAHLLADPQMVELVIKPGDRFERAGKWD
jgi:hypothetical protein